MQTIPQKQGWPQWAGLDPADFCGPFSRHFPIEGAIVATGAGEGTKARGVNSLSFPFLPEIQVDTKINKSPLLNSSFTSVLLPICNYQEPPYLSISLPEETLTTACYSITEYRCSWTLGQKGRSLIAKTHAGKELP